MKHPTWAFNIFADSHQFLLADADADWSVLADAWTAEAVRKLFVQGHGFVAIGTARDMPVPVQLRLLPEATASPADCDRINEGFLDVPSGTIEVMGVTDNGMSGGRIPIPSGRYHVRVLYYGLGTSSPDGLTGDDRYEVELWSEQASN